MRPLSTVDDNLKRDEKLNNLISSLKCKGPACRLKKTRHYGPDIPVLKLVITDH